MRQEPVSKQDRLIILQNQVARLNRRLEQFKTYGDRYFWARFAVFVGGVALSIAAFAVFNGIVGWITVLVALIVFNVVAHFQRKLDRSIARHRVWLELKTQQIARIQLDWPRIPSRPSPPAPADHPFGIDLDLVGERSLHQLVDTAASKESSERLREWLLNPVPNREVMCRRQALVKELAPLSRFRDRLTLEAMLSAKDLSEQWEGKKLLSWLGQHKGEEGLRTLLLILAPLSAANIILLALAFLGLIPNIWLITLLVYVFIALGNSTRIKDLFDDAFTLRDGLGVLRAVLGFLEKYNYGPNKHLRELCSPYLDQKTRPGAVLREVARVVTGAAIQRSQILAIPLNLAVPWDYYFAYRLGQCKRKVEKVLPQWLEVWYELETLNSLASFTYLNPEYSFPAVEENGANFRADELGHPLIRFDEKVCNSFSLKGPGEIVIITGSNMSGKSTFLRTIGINLVLAYAGGPVNARHFEASLFKIFTCIKVSDSLAEGYSYFYAEVRRLKALLTALEEARDMPLFFLIDEIFRGTNNRERLIGSRSYMRALAGKNGIGVVSTHDLELVKLADELGQVHNYHFREEVIDGQMVFDYKLRSGPSPTTNALKIMRLEGLPVEEKF